MGNSSTSLRRRRCCQRRRPSSSWGRSCVGWNICMLASLPTSTSRCPRGPPILAPRGSRGCRASPEPCSHPCQLPRVLPCPPPPLHRPAVPGPVPTAREHHAAGEGRPQALDQDHRLRAGAAAGGWRHLQEPLWDPPVHRYRAGTSRGVPAQLCSGGAAGLLWGSTARGPPGWGRDPPGMQGGRWQDGAVPLMSHPGSVFAPSSRSDQL